MRWQPDCHLLLLTSCSAGAGRDALPRVRRFARLDVSFCCFCERALALSELRLFPVLFFHWHFLWTCGAGSRGSASLPVATASANQMANLVCRLASNGDVVALQMGRRQGEKATTV